jgi:hypothetical protein
MTATGETGLLSLFLYRAYISVVFQSGIVYIFRHILFLINGRHAGWQTNIGLTEKIE